MRLLWRQAEAQRTIYRPGQVNAAPVAQPCPSLARVLERVSKVDGPEILDMGSYCGATAVYLAGRGGRVRVEEFQLPRATAARKRAENSNGDEEPVEDPIRIDHEDCKFDLVLAWETIDFISSERLAELGGELRRVLAPGGWLLFFSLNIDSSGSQRPARYRVVEDGKLVREATNGPACARWVHPTREIERALAPLSIQGIHLQRNQMREFLALKT